MRFLRANAAQYHLHPARFASFGDSAGGHLSALLATSGGVKQLEGAVGGNLEQSSRVQVAVDYYGPTDMLHLADDVTSVIDQATRRLWGANLRQLATVFEQTEITRVLGVHVVLALGRGGQPELHGGGEVGHSLTRITCQSEWC